MFKTKSPCRAVVTHSFNPSIQEAEAGGFLSSRPSLVYRVSSRTARAIQRNPVSKNKTNKQTNKQKDKVSLSSPDWPQTHCNPPASAFQCCIYRHYAWYHVSLENKKPSNESWGLHPDQDSELSASLPPQTQKITGGLLLHSQWGVYKAWKCLSTNTPVHPQVLCHSLAEE